MDTTETVSEQAAQAGDVPTSQEGQPQSFASSVPKEKPKELPKEEDTAKPKDPPNEDAKKKRISDKEWQERTEQAQKTVELEEQLSDEQQEKQKLSERLEKLEELNTRKDWELDHPIVRDDRYKEAWEAVNKEKRYKDLTYEERWRLVSKEDASALTKELVNQARKAEGSVPPSSRTAPSKPSLDPAAVEMGKFWGNKPEDFERYGVM